MTEEPGASSAKTDNVIEGMRDALWRLNVEERKSRRVADSNKNRRTLGEIESTMSPWDAKLVAEKANQLKKRPLSMENYLGLINALIQDEANISSFLARGALRALVRDLSGMKPGAQLPAANCCCNIALSEDAKVCKKVAKAVSFYLVSLLDTMNYPLIEICVWTVGNLIGGSRDAFQILHDQGCLKQLLDLVKEGPDSVLAAAVYALKHFLCRGCAVVNDAELVELIETVLTRCFLDDPDALWLLALTSSRESSAHLLAPLGTEVFEILCKEFEAPIPNDLLMIAAVRFLGNTVCQESPNPSESLAEAIFQNSDETLLTIFGKLMDHRQDYFRRETLWLLSNIYTYSSPSIKERTGGLVSHFWAVPRIREALEA